MDVQVEIAIAVPREKVAAFAGDPSNAPRWYANIKSVVWVTAPPIALGSKMTFVAQFLGKRLEYTYEIVEFVPGAKLVMRTAQGPFPMETTYTWEERGASTFMTLRNRGEPSGFSKLLGPVMAIAMRRETKKDLARLKAVM